MTITPEQREARRTSIGSSDIAAIMGLHPNLSPADVWAEKVFETEDRASEDWFETGDALEPGICEWVAKQLGLTVKLSPPTKTRKPHFHANLDGILSDGSIVEAKTGNGVGWGEPGTDEVPVHVLAQVQWQMYVTGAKHAYIGAALASDYGIRMRMYQSARDDEVIKGMRKYAIDWWRTHVLEHSRPGDAPVKLELLKRVRREPGTRVHIQPFLIDAWVQAQEELKEARAHEKRTKEILLEAMGDAEGARTEEYEITYMEQSRKEAVIPASTFRVLRKKKISPAE